jgi:hypothetical protein
MHAVFLGTTAFQNKIFDVPVADWQINKLATDAIIDTLKLRGKLAAEPLVMEEGRLDSLYGKQACEWAPVSTRLQGLRGSCQGPGRGCSAGRRTHDQRGMNTVTRNAVLLKRRSRKRLLPRSGSAESPPLGRN